MITTKNRKYELIIIFNPNTQDAAVEERITKLEEIARNHKGSIEKREIWGRRSLAYPINNFKHAVFAVLNVQGEGTIVSEMTRHLKLSEEVMRSSVVTKDAYSPDLDGRLKGDFTYGYKPPHTQFGGGFDMSDDDEMDSAN